VFLARASSNLSGVAKIDEFALFPLPHLRISFRNNVSINCTLRPHLWISVGTNKDDLECPIQLNVRMSHGLLADSVDTSLAIVYYNSCTTDAMFSEVHDQ